MTDIPTGVTEKVEPTIAEINRRIDKLHADIERGKVMVTDYARERPMQMLGMAALGGVVFGFLVGAAFSKKN